MDPAALESLIVREIRKSKEISRRDLAEKLSIAKSTAGRRIDSMIERGLVRESGIEDRKGVGRPRRFLALCGGYGAYAGFDFDARHLYGVLIDFAQATLERRKIRFSAHPDRNEVLARIAETLAEFRSRAHGGSRLVDAQRCNLLGDSRRSIFGHDGYREVVCGRQEQHGVRTQSRAAHVIEACSDLLPGG